MNKYEIIGVIDKAINDREPNFCIRGQQPEKYIAAAILDTLLALNVINYDLYSELFDYYISK